MKESIVVEDLHSVSCVESVVVAVKADSDCIPVTWARTSRVGWSTVAVDLVAMANLHLHLHLVPSSLSVTHKQSFDALRDIELLSFFLFPRFFTLKRRLVTSSSILQPFTK